MEFDMKLKNGSFLAVLTNNRLLGLSLILLVGVIGFSLYLFLKTTEDNLNESAYVEHADDLRVLSQVLTRNATQAVGGVEKGFDQLAETRNMFDHHLMMLSEGDAATNMPPVAADSHGLAEIQAAWAQMKDQADQIVNAKQTVLKLRFLEDNMDERFHDLGAAFDEIVALLVDANASPAQVALAQKQGVIAERIIHSIDKLLAGGEDSFVAADAFSQDTRQFGLITQGMLQGNSALGITRIRDAKVVAVLNDVLGEFEQVAGDVTLFLENFPELFLVHENVKAIYASSEEVMNTAGHLKEEFGASHHATRFVDEFTQWVLLGSTVMLLILLIGFVVIRDTQKDLARSGDANEQNQNAILRLLDELADLADGDLTTQATVTEDFTGAIADSINFAIDQMRSLVSAINITALQVASAAQETQATAMHLAEASEHQAQEIAGASAAVNEMAVSIDQVSANAAESSAVAERSVSIAKKGADVVQATINGMDNIREQIQETSKRIKRLGESSQEIGDIVSLINDIADQTNILALNAAIQASMAGDAGRGFAVVADEVQRLAERSSAATRQIEALVKTIQTDTNEAVISMEQTTSEVVQGARLAQDAGVALEEIENVSKNLADLIQNISNAARQQASSAGHISNTMNVIQEITSQTSAGTTATAKSIGNLNDLANEMRASVAGFKLPDEDDHDAAHAFDDGQFPA
jgi:twitching motility protein PilJ